MCEYQEKLTDFHNKFKLTVNNIPVLPGDSVIKLRDNLIKEESLEFSDASSNRDLVAIGDAIADLLYVVYGAAVSYGLDAQALFDEVHRSNMTKLWYDISSIEDDPQYVISNAGDGCYVVKRASDGKVIKPPTYSHADIKSVIERLRGDAPGEF